MPCTLLLTTSCANTNNNIHCWSEKRRTKSTYPHYYLIILLFLGLPCLSFSQDVGELANRLTNLREERLSITGGIQLNSQHYWNTGIAARRDNWQWGVRANLNFSLLGFSAPFSLVFSDANTNYRLPSYTFLGISPKYKWATLHLGDRSLSFSRYTMSGISFRGTGFTLEPGRWHISAFYGKLNRALASDLDALGNLNDYLTRRGYGTRLGFNGNKGSYFLNFFGANDDENELPLSLAGTLLTPTSNRVVSLEARQEVIQDLTVSTELAHSLYNANINAADLQDSDYNFGNRLGGIFKPNQSYISGQAYNLGLFYTFKQWGLQSRYERVERGFRTLGSLFFNDDTENITLGVNRHFLDNKISIYLNGGLERVNLDNEELEQTSRVIGSANLSYRPNEDWMFSTGYSNFKNDTKLRTRTNLLQPVDSIFLAQVNQSVNAMAIRKLGSKERPASLSFILNHQRANNVVNDEVQDDANSRFSNIQLTYSTSTSKDSWKWNTGISYNQSTLGVFQSRAISPSFGLQRSFWNNTLNTNFRSAFSFFEQQEEQYKVLNLGLSGSYQLNNSHQLSLRTTHINRFNSPSADKNFSEWYGQIVYGYRFGGSIGKKPAITQ